LIEVRPVQGLPEIEPGAALGAMLADAAAAAAGDVVVVSQKAVSKAEGRIRELAAVTPGEQATELARTLEKDARLVQLILDESRAVIRAQRGVLIVRTHGGLVCANAGIDASNVPGDERVTLLPEDADSSARRLRAEIREQADVAPAVVVADSFGRPWRLGQTDVAIGCAGLMPLDDWRGRPDREGRVLEGTAIAVADEAAAAASLARDKTAGVPAAVISGLAHFVTADDGPGAAALRRAEGDDLFR
jgi:coenzyme F420-0:L-glutamate ligase/coenzyme F420-1:gamma-L-glutamate ligase